MRNVELVFSEKNIGLGKSQNDGIDFFLSRKKYQNIIFFDQDTKISKNCIESMKNEIDALKINGYKVGAISPSLINSYSSKVYEKYKKIRNLKDVLEVREVMLSGMIIPIETFNEVGKFREDFFMDLIDFEWCWRARSFGFRIFQSKKAFAHHYLGEGDKIFLGSKISIPKPERITSQISNFRKVMNLEYTPKIWIFLNLLKYFVKFFYYSYFLKDGNKYKYHFKQGLKGSEIDDK